MDWLSGLIMIFGLNPQEHLPTRKAFRNKFHPEDRNRVDESLLNRVAQESIVLRPRFATAPTLRRTDAAASVQIREVSGIPTGYARRYPA
jgi:hypothetical protein